MPSTAKARKAAAKKAAATRAANRVARVAAPAPVNEPSTPRADAAKHGPRRPSLADGKKPHDPVTHADLIQYGIISAPSEADEKAAQKAAQVDAG